MESLQIWWNLRHLSELVTISIDIFSTISNDSILLYSGTRYQLINHTLYRHKDCLFPSRCEGVQYFLLKLTDLPDFEIIVNPRDYPQVSKHFSTKIPIFSFSKVFSCFILLPPKNYRLYISSNTTDTKIPPISQVKLILGKVKEKCTLVLLANVNTEASRVVTFRINLIAAQTFWEVIGPLHLYFPYVLMRYFRTSSDFPI